MAGAAELSLSRLGPSLRPRPVQQGAQEQQPEPAGEPEQPPRAVRSAQLAQAPELAPPQEALSARPPEEPRASRQPEALTAEPVEARTAAGSRQASEPPAAVEGAAARPRPASRAHRPRPRCRNRHGDRLLSGIGRPSGRSAYGYGSGEQDRHRSNWSGSSCLERPARVGHR